MIGLIPTSNRHLSLSSIYESVFALPIVTAQQGHHPLALSTYNCSCFISLISFSRDGSGDRRSPTQREGESSVKILNQALAIFHPTCDTSLSMFLAA